MIKFGDDSEAYPVISIDKDFKEISDTEFLEHKRIPFLALRNLVLFPGVVLPISVGREYSLEAIKQLKRTKDLIAIGTQKNKSEDEPKQEDIYEVGTLAKVIKVIQMPDGGVTIIVQGHKKMSIDLLVDNGSFFEVEYTIKQETFPESDSDKKQYFAEIEHVRDMAERIIKLSPDIPIEATIALKNIDNSNFLVNFIVSNMKLSIKQKQKFLAIDQYFEKVSMASKHLQNEINLLELKRDIRRKTEKKMNDQQRSYFLNQQLKAIKDELGQGETTEFGKLLKLTENKKWSAATEEHFLQEFEKLQRLNSQSPEYSVQINYLELFAELPWDEMTKEKIDLEKATEVLDRDHFGMQKVKKRILEHLAVLKLKDNLKSPILCFVGPPGVGKTSLGKSIAEALGRKYVRIALGGLHDESEIRGHRRTYIGSMPGRIIQSLKKVGVSNPVVVLDEIDKIATNSFKGDPSSALLEVLDPEQNSAFHDNYLDYDYDLSNVLFIATSNELSTIQPALRDRMEIIEVNGYSIEEKVQIAKKHLVKKQRKLHGLKAKQVRISDKVLEDLVVRYTRESGVRSLDRAIAGLMRYAAKEIVMGSSSVSIKVTDLEKINGPYKFEKDPLDKTMSPGVAVGLAWTRVGGDILYIESVQSKGKGNLVLTGQLGDVMKESAKTALSFIKSNAEQLGLDDEVFKTTDFHVHVPEGAVPKDGPSAGITMLTALISLLKKQPIRKNLAMTGEITLRGKVLPVGGIKEKVLAANRMGITDIIMCHSNEKHVKEIDQEIIKDMHFHYVEEMLDVLDIALTK